ncbi:MULTISPECIES: DUF3289 family protein [Lelliottia]|uniref:DUF3289 family protein n=1 Tax=Lelliottia aquatilis TaxID=2080838 RepID=A0ABX5A4R5_9ENTR|nr:MULTISPECIES: DUF3289 family protein [Lelliottia]NTZ45040.1 DUF3289 family protein [Lelliottia aquatilis]POZ25733.1 hypothetical protein C3712_03100 [Lelliottia aquatilis]POZ28888.1 hypothetical protein C3708_03100 [Lelliottia sp. 7254-16]POZ29286.1 hypothetical protein C3711_04330 [Lelliottia aquatilis]POZ33193.1 hypothetical protein C3710_07090 [Lelliottia aquatilis]
MNLDMFLSTQFPKVIFSTFHRFENYYISDMQYGDLSDNDFFRMGLRDISAKVDPFRLLEFDSLTSFRPLGMNFPTNTSSGRPISRQRCAAILFNEMKELSTQFAHGKYANLISELIEHFRFGNGTPWHSEQLDCAYKEIVEGIGTNDVLNTIIETINTQLISKQQACLEFEFFTALMKTIKHTTLPKFIRFEDKYNGLGISVHDVYAQEISLVYFHRFAMSWSCLLYFRAQDHFGLGVEDITDSLYKNFRFFRIWFFLQQHNKFAYKPFLTNFSAHINIGGGI